MPIPTIMPPKNQIRKVPHGSLENGSGVKALIVGQTFEFPGFNAACNGIDFEKSSS